MAAKKMVSVPASVQPIWAEVVNRARNATGVAGLSEGQVLEIACRGFLMLDGAGGGRPNVFARTLQARLATIIQASLRHAGHEGATASVENDLTVVRIPGYEEQRFDWAGAQLDPATPEIGL